VIGHVLHPSLVCDARDSGRRGEMEREEGGKDLLGRFQGTASGDFSVLLC
jgi:hypothetical protein